MTVEKQGLLPPYCTLILLLGGGCHPASGVAQAERCDKGYNTTGHRVTKEGKVSLTWEGEGRLPRGGASFAES